LYSSAVIYRRRPDGVAPEDLAKAAREMAGVEIEMNAKDLPDALDARRFLETRACEGGVNPAHVCAHRTGLSKALDGHEAWFGVKRTRSHRCRESRGARQHAGRRYLKGRGHD